MKFKVVIRAGKDELGSMTCRDSEVQSIVPSMLFVALGTYRDNQGRIVEAEEITVTLTPVGE